MLMGDATSENRQTSGMRSTVPNPPFGSRYTVLWEIRYVHWAKYIFSSTIGKILDTLSEHFLTVETGDVINIL